MDALLNDMNDFLIEAEFVVKALAACDDPVMEYHGGDYCVLCDAEWPGKEDDHLKDCPWRMARAWVRANQEEKDAAQRTQADI